MVCIANHDLNKDLDRYLSSRRESSSWNLFSPRKAKPKKVDEVPEGLSHERIYVIPGKPAKGGPNMEEDLSPEEMRRLEAMQRDLERVNRAERAHPEYQAELEEERESLLERFFAFFRGAERRRKLAAKAEELAFQEEAMVREAEEVKRILKVVHHWLERLPAEEKKAFKQSPDFQEYKAALEKYGVAKRK